MRRLALLTVVLALALTPAAAEAQARLLIGGGLSQPSGDFADDVDSGLHGRVGLQVGVPVFPVSLRGEGELHQFSEKAGTDNTTTMLNGTLSAVLSLGGIGLSPYVIGGVGTYRLDSGVADPVTNRGVHGGFGVSLGALGFGGFAEIRLVNISGTGGADATRFIPLTVGLRF